jgi:predicted nucleic acid-binding Zn finger protein
MPRVKTATGFVYIRGAMFFLYQEFASCTDICWAGRSPSQIFSSELFMEIDRFRNISSHRSEHRNHVGEMKSKRDSISVQIISVKSGIGTLIPDYALKNQIEGKN